MIYDCFLFHNEIELLEIRLEELDRYVDRFVLISALETHSGNRRQPIYYLNKDSRFKKWQHKIYHILLSHLIGETARERQAYQRDAAIAALIRCKDDDLVMISDVDEIPKGSSISNFDPSRKDVGFFNQNYHCYYLNGIIKKSSWPGTVITTYQFLTRGFSGSLQKLSLYAHPMFGHPEKAQTILDGGWHFTFIGGLDRIIDKVRSFGAQEFNTNEFINREHIKTAVNAGADIFKRFGPGYVRYIPIDGGFPEMVVKERKKYASLIREITE